MDVEIKLLAVKKQIIVWTFYITYNINGLLVTLPKVYATSLWLHRHTLHIYTSSLPAVNGCAMFVSWQLSLADTLCYGPVKWNIRRDIISIIF